MKGFRIQAMTTKHFNFPDTVPLQYRDRAIRLTGSRITLDIIVGWLEMGDTPEDIQDHYPWFTLEQINAIIAWYLANRAEVDEYLREGEEEAEKFRLEIESRPESIAFREKMRRLREQRLNNLK
jgi:uncharacterized protein (DUF433 family)